MSIAQERYEYKYTFISRYESPGYDNVVSELNTLGSKGWHVVAMISQKGPYGEGGYAVFLERRTC